MPGWLATTGQYRRIDGGTGPRRDPHDYLRHLLGIHPVGSPHLCVRRLADTVAVTGVRRLLLMVEGAGDPVRTLTNIDRLGAEVLPCLRATHADNRI
jgi:hypothetical protein